MIAKAWWLGISQHLTSASTSTRGQIITSSPAQRKSLSKSILRAKRRMSKTWRKSRRKWKTWYRSIKLAKFTRVQRSMTNKRRLRMLSSKEPKRSFKRLWSKMSKTKNSSCHRWNLSPSCLKNRSRGIVWYRIWRILKIMNLQVNLQVNQKVALSHNKNLSQRLCT